LAVLRLASSTSCSNCESLHPRTALRLSQNRDATDTHQRRIVTPATRHRAEKCDATDTPAHLQSTGLSTASSGFADRLTRIFPLFGSGSLVGADVVARFGDHVVQRLLAGLEEVLRIAVALAALELPRTAQRELQILK